MSATAVALTAARRRRQVDCDLLRVGAGEVVDRDVVGAAQRRKLDVLDAVEVHGDVADVAEHPHPLAIGRDVDVLADIGAVEHQRIGAGLTLDHVAAVTRIPDEGVVAVAEQRDIVAATADHGVVAVAAYQGVVALASGDGVVAGTAIDREADDTGREAGSGDDVVASTAIDDELVVGSLGAGKGNRCGQAGDRDRASRSRHLNVVVAVGAVDGHAIGRAVAHAAAGCRCEVDRDLGDAGAGEVAYRDVIGTAEGVRSMCSTPLRSIATLPTSRVNFTRPRLAVISNVLVDVGAVEHQRVGAVLAFDSVAAVARIPDEGVVAGAAEQGVVAAAAGDDVIAVAADQRVVAVAAGDGVVAGAAVDGELDQAGEAVAGGEDVVAAVHVKHEVLGGADVERERRRAETIEAHAGAVGRDRKDFGAVAAIDLGGVDAVAALHQVGALARVPDHEVVAGLAEHLVVAGAAGQRVVAVAAEQKIVAALAFSVSLPAPPNS